ncbi:MAG: thioredoxin family protein [Proteobacteria bacterium]|nr:thioredoxin family protein [Pseudomonadota bacterium]
MKIEILGPGCPKCKTLLQNAEKAMKDLSLQAEIVKIEDIEKIMEAGIMMTPALVVDGKIISTGKILSVNEIKKVLQ